MRIKAVKVFVYALGAKKKLFTTLVVRNTSSDEFRSTVYEMLDNLLAYETSKIA